ncbi:MAG: hypothetical protein Q8N53_16755 [Longimicrobiales bacterium]|nr:hypothetical protein [Longimicrobiales bacterium]
MPPTAPKDMIGRSDEWERLLEFAGGPQEAAILGIVWGRRRIGKSFLLQSLVERIGGFYYEAIRGSSAEALRDLGEQLGHYQQAAAPLALPDWDSAVGALLALGADRDVTVVLDEYPYLLEHTPQLDSILQRAFGPRSPIRSGSRTRLILCGSALSVMGRILSGTAPLRGRAAMDMQLSAFDFREARKLHEIEHLVTAVRTFAVIGGVPAYAREMVGGDLPSAPNDLDRWVARRVLSPSSPLFREAGLLLSEDPAASRARKVNLYHAALAGIATGHHVHGRLTSYVKLSGASLAPIVEALVSAGLVERVLDPVRDNRPTYHPADSLIRFHYAVIRRHQGRLARHGADVAGIWQHILPTFNSRVVGPCFEAMARHWAAHFAAVETLGGEPDHVGPTTVSLPGGAEGELDVVVASDDADAASDRTVLSMGEAKAGERLSPRHLNRLEAARTALGKRAENARILLFGAKFTQGLTAEAARRSDVELIDLDRLYSGS